MLATPVGYAGDRAVTARISDEPAGALEVARKLLLPFSQASDSPICVFTSSRCRLT